MLYTTPTNLDRALNQTPAAVGGRAGLEVWSQRRLSSPPHPWMAIVPPAIHESVHDLVVDRCIVVDHHLRFVWGAE